MTLPSRETLLGAAEHVRSEVGRPVAGTSSLDVLGHTPDVRGWVRGRFGPLQEWIDSHLEPFVDVFEALAADLPAVDTHDAGLRRLAESLRHEGEVDRVVATRLREGWTGPAAEAAAGLAGALGTASNSYADVIVALADAHSAVATEAARVKSALITYVGSLVWSLAREASRALALEPLAGPASFTQFVAWAGRALADGLRRVVADVRAGVAAVERRLADVRRISGLLDDAAGRISTGGTT